MSGDASAPRPPRRKRYAGKNPRRFEDKYKEREPLRHAATVEKVLAAGKTPAGTHRPIMVAEVLAALDPQPGEAAVDATLGYGGHAREILRCLQPGGRLVGLDADPLELPKTEARLREQGFAPPEFVAVRSNFAGLSHVLAATGLAGVDCLLADLGVSSMQLDNPARGFSLKAAGPLDLRLNPLRGQPAAALLAKLTPAALAALLVENADEPAAATLAPLLAGREFPATTALAAAVRSALPQVRPELRELSVRRVFQALRIAVNDEFSALDALLRQLPGCLKPAGRVAILSFHSGEDRRVKRAFAEGVSAGVYRAVAGEPVRPSRAEQEANPRSSSAKLRWAIRVDPEN